MKMFRNLLIVVGAVIVSTQAWSSSGADPVAILDLGNNPAAPRQGFQAGGPTLPLSNTHRTAAGNLKTTIDPTSPVSRSVMFKKGFSMATWENARNELMAIENAPAQEIGKLNLATGQFELIVRAASGVTAQVGGTFKIVNGRVELNDNGKVPEAMKIHLIHMINWANQNNVKLVLFPGHTRNTR